MLTDRTFNRTLPSPDLYHTSGHKNNQKASIGSVSSRFKRNLVNKEALSSHRNIGFLYRNHPESLELTIQLFAQWVEVAT